MKKKVTIAMNKKFFLVLGIALVLLIGVVALRSGKKDGDAVYNSLSPHAKKLYFEQSDKLTKDVDPRLVELDQLTIGCFGANKIMQMKDTDPNLGGQCCGVLQSIDAYNEQLAALDQYIKDHGDLDLIPKDPYDVSVEQAKTLTAFDSSLVLSAEQQAIYDEAVTLSHHGGPCCCKCWKWYVMSGLAKKLIMDYKFGALDIAELWDTSSSCGHDEDTNMYKHYKIHSQEQGAPQGHTGH